MLPFVIILPLTYVFLFLIYAGALTIYSLSLMDVGVNKLSIKRRMGHASQDITDKVTHKEVEELKKSPNHEGSGILRFK